MYKKPESVLIIVHDPDGRILLLKRSDIEDFWQSVTGSLRWGESVQAAAVRELEEETGIEAVGRLKNWHQSVTFRILDAFKPRYEPGTRHNLEHLFSIGVERDQPVRLNPAEHTAYAWIATPEALQTVWSWSNRDAIATVAKKHHWIT